MSPFIMSTVCNVNGWLYSEKLQVPKKNQHNLLQFMKGVADVLLFAGKEPVRTTPGRPKKQTSSPTRIRGKKPMVPVDIRYGGIHHWPEFGDKRKICRECSMLSLAYCSKCQIYLCLQKERNCFKQFRD